MRSFRFRNPGGPDLDRPDPPVPGRRGHPGRSGGDLHPECPLLDLTAQLEGGTITLTDHTSGKTYTGTLSPAEDAAPNTQVYTLVFPDQPEGYGVYGITEYADGNRDATLYLTINAQTLRLTAPLSKP